MTFFDFLKSVSNGVWCIGRFDKVINSGGLSSECKQVKKNQITLCPQQNKWRKKFNNIGPGCFLELAKQMVCTFCLLPTFWTPGGANVRGTLVFVCFWQCYHLAMYFCSVLVNDYVIATVIKSQLWLHDWIMEWINIYGWIYGWTSTYQNLARRDLSSLLGL